MPGGGGDGGRPKQSRGVAAEEQVRWQVRRSWLFMILRVELGGRVGRDACVEWSGVDGVMRGVEGWRRGVLALRREMVDV